MMKSEGVCRLCNKTFSGRGMTRHLQSCIGRKEPKSKGGDEKIFLIKASAGPFWVYFEVNGSSTLGNVDSFLRSLWLECCGHLSAFTIGSVRYYSHALYLEPGEKGMDIPLENVLKPRVKFLHEYDFGTTTKLDMECVSERQDKMMDRIEILARNNMIEILCDECGKPAKEIRTQCVWEGEGFLCESCAKKHECGEEMLLPVVNSPRMGVCGYTGGAEDIF
jgi:hypothetical protein